MFPRTFLRTVHHVLLHLCLNSLNGLNPSLPDTVHYWKNLWFIITASLRLQDVHTVHMCISNSTLAPSQRRNNIHPRPPPHTLPPSLMCHLVITADDVMIMVVVVEIDRGMLDGQAGGVILERAVVMRELLTNPLSLSLSTWCVLQARVG